MRTTALIARPILEKRPNGFGYRHKFRRIRVPVKFTEFSVEIPVQSKTVVIIGNFKLTVAEAKKQVNMLCEFTITNKYGQTRVLRDGEKPFYKLFAFIEQKLVRLYRYEIRIVACVGTLNCLSNVRQLNLMRITISDVFLDFIDLSSLWCLHYVKITNVGLKNIVFGRGSLEYCNLSNNKLTNCHVRSKMFNLSSNRIKIFVSNYNYRLLNLSDNPLKGVFARANVIDVSRTKLTHPLFFSAKKIIANEVSGIEIGHCPNLIVLHINNCKLKALPKNLEKLKCLKARNNYLTEFPALDILEYADLSCNLLTKVPSRSLKHVDISINHVKFFDTREFPNLVSINLGFNPILKDKLYNPENVAFYDQSNRLFTTQIEYPGPGGSRSYHCFRQNRYIMKYTMKTHVCGSPVTFFIFHNTMSGDDLCEKLQAAYEAVERDPQPLYLFQNLVTATMGVFSATSLFSKCSFVLVSKTIVLVESHGIDLVYSDFAEVEKVTAKEKIRAFYNAGRWYIFPVLCYMREDVLLRCRKLGVTILKVDSIFKYLGFYCPLGLELVIKDNDLHSYDSSKVILLKRIFDKTYNKSFARALRKYELGGGKNISWQMNYHNIDFGMEFHCDFTNYNAVNLGRPVLVFIKFYYPETEDYSVVAEIPNTMRILRFLTHIFAGSFVEQNHQCCIVGFNSPISSALWALRLQKILRIARIEIGVGISEDTLFRTVVDGIVVLGGPALNKLSRVASLGVGIFISEFINISHPFIKLVDEGYVQFKGFSNTQCINSIHFRE